MKRFVLLAPAVLLAACLPHPPAPPAPYRAFDSAAGWTLVIDDQSMHFLADQGRTHVIQPTPRPITGIAGDIYQSPRIRANIVHAPCLDRVTGRTLPDTVQVEVDGKRHDGCGDPPAAVPVR